MSVFTGLRAYLDSSRESAAKEKFEATKQIIKKLDTVLMVEELYKNGHFIHTAEGPHYCQIGKKYRLWQGGKSTLCIATEKVDIRGTGKQDTMVFSLVDPADSSSVGLANLDRITDEV